MNIIVLAIDDKCEGCVFFFVIQETEMKIALLLIKVEETVPLFLLEEVTVQALLPQILSSH